MVNISGNSKYVDINVNRWFCVMLVVLYVFSDSLINVEISRIRI